jgi:uncharacterized protein
MCRAATVAEHDLNTLAATIAGLTRADKLFLTYHAIHEGKAQYHILALLPGKAQLSFRHYQELIHERCHEYGVVNLWCCHSAAARRFLATGHIFYLPLCIPERLVYDSERWPLIEHLEINTEEVMQQARGAFASLFATARSFLDSAAHAISNERLSLAAFLLHQATEQALRALLLAVTGYNGRGHHLDHWLRHADYFMPSLSALFPRDSTYEKHLFHLLDDAYLHARYRRDYTISPNEVKTLLHRVERLHIQVQQIFETQLITFQSYTTCKTKSN